MDHGGVAVVGFFVACGDATELFKITEEVFDEMTPFVNVKIAGHLAGTVGLRRDDGAGPPPIELGAQPIIVEGLVAEQSIECDSIDQWLDPDAVVALAGQKNEAYEIAERVDHCDDLGGQATSRPANGLISSPPFAPVPCWWTRTMVPSIFGWRLCTLLTDG